MIYVDKKGHLVTNGDINELHSFAQQLDLKREWFQDHKKHPHYDLCSRDGKPSNYKIWKAQELGAKLVSTRQIVKIFQNK